MPDLSNLRVAVIGLGDIAQKAYLPILSTLPNIELIFCTRNGEQLKRLAQRYRVAEYVTDFHELAKCRVDVAFIHAATEAHEMMVSFLLEQGIAVYVDKPLAYRFDASRRLVDLALQRRKLLVVGFNRRFAPLYRELAAQPARRIVSLQKNRLHLPDIARRFVFDDFIHVVDTLRFFAPAAIDAVDVRGSVQAGLLHHVALYLHGADFSLHGLMNRDSGATEEVLEVMSPGHKWQVRGLNTLVHWHGGAEAHRGFKDWDTVLFRRGFPQLIQHVVDSVRAGSDGTAALQDALLTHELCENIVLALEAQPAQFR